MFHNGVLELTYALGPSSVPLAQGMNKRSGRGWDVQKSYMRASPKARRRLAPRYSS